MIAILVHPKYRKALFRYFMHNETSRKVKINKCFKGQNTFNHFTWIEFNWIYTL